MTFWQRWWLRLRVEDTSEEAQIEMSKLEELDPEVDRLSCELREIQRRNNFSGMVDRAIRWSAREGS